MKIEVADILRRFGPLYLQRYEESMLPSHKKVIHDIQRCRTEAMGGHVYRCGDCGKKVYVYHACRNRHCPACHSDQIRKWLDQRMTELLPCDYFHVTVTVPQTLRAVSRSNQKLMYSLLMKTAAEALMQLADDPKHLGGRVGILAVMHTWTGSLSYHPHVHMLVTGGGVSPDGQWVSCKNKYLVSVRALSRLIRGKFAARLKKNHIELYNSIDTETWSTDWVVHSLHYNKGQAAVLKYLSRYVFRIAITNHRIVSMDQTHVTFRYKDRRAKKWRTCRVEGCEFIRRYLQHVLPKGFHKVRYYGIWHSSSNYYVGKLAKQMALTDEATVNDLSLQADSPQEKLLVQNKEIKCPHCGSEQLQLLQRLPRPRSRSPSAEMRN